MSEYLDRIKVNTDEVNKIKNGIQYVVDFYNGIIWDYEGDGCIESAYHLGHIFQNLDGSEIRLDQINDNVIKRYCLDYIDICQNLKTDSTCDKNELALEDVIVSGLILENNQIKDLFKEYINIVFQYIYKGKSYGRLGHHLGHGAVYLYTRLYPNELCLYSEYLDKFKYHDEYIWEIASGYFSLMEIDENFFKTYFSSNNKTFKSILSKIVIEKIECLETYLKNETKLSQSFYELLLNNIRKINSTNEYVEELAILFNKNADEMKNVKINSLSLMEIIKNYINENNKEVEIYIRNITDVDEKILQSSDEYELEVLYDIRGYIEEDKKGIKLHNSDYIMICNFFPDFKNLHNFMKKPNLDILSKKQFMRLVELYFGYMKAWNSYRYIKNINFDSLLKLYPEFYEDIISKEELEKHL